ncbi:MAG: hypothetical protein QF561_01180 [Phycisphaerales bacterium]|jgi:hypothetical protein|nr:hypothetical protein [Phycisphaerales bacterium]
MNPSDHIATLHRRLGQIEADHARLRRRTRWLQVGCLTAAGLVVLLAASDITRVDTLRAHRLEIIDADGHVVLAASGRAAGGQLDLWSPDGANLIRMGANQSGGDLAVWNTRGANVAGVWATADGGEFGAWNSNGKRAATMAATPTGGHVAIAERSGAPQIQLNAGESPAIRLLDEHGERARIEPGLAVLSGDDGAARVTLSSLAQGPPLLLTAPGTPAASGPHQIAAAFTADGGLVTITSDTAAATITGHSMELSQAGTRTSLHASEGGGAWRAGEGALQLSGADLALTHHGETLLRTTAVDGEVSLQLTAPDGSAAIRAGAAASLDLHGPEASIHLTGQATESVAIASGATMPILSTSDDAISMYASGGAGRVVLGSGEGGQVRLTGGTDGMRPAVDILAADRTRIATLSSTGSGLGMLAVADASGAPVGLLHAAEQGRARLAVHGRGGSAVATAAADGTPEFALISTDGRTRAALAATARGGALNLMNSDGTPVVLAGITADGPGGAAAFQNGNGDTVVAAGSTHDNTGRIVVTE